MSPSIKKGPKRKPVECDMCRGRGTVQVRDERGRITDVECTQCGGQGEL